MRNILAGCADIERLARCGRRRGNCEHFAFRAGIAGDGDACRELGR